MRSRPFAPFVLAAAALSGAAQAETPPLQGVVSLSSSASIEVTKDLLNVVMTTTREGQDAATVQSQLKQALDAALAEARKAARPGQLEVQTGNFSLYPRYAAKGGINGWQGSAELVIEGKDMPAIGQLTGRIGTMTIGRVGYGVSRELREKVEGEVTAQAIARYRAKAAYYAKQFGDEDDKALADRARQDAAETPMDVARRFAHRWPEIVSWGAFVAVALLWATGGLA